MMKLISEERYYSTNPNKTTQLAHSFTHHVKEVLHHVKEVGSTVKIVENKSRHCEEFCPAHTVVASTHLSGDLHGMGKLTPPRLADLLSDLMVYACFFTRFFNLKISGWSRPNFFLFSTVFCFTYLNSMAISMCLSP